MDYGISQVILNELGPVESIRKLREIGYERVEVHSRYLDPRFTNAAVFEELVAALEDTGIVAAQAHLPFWSGIDIGNYNEIVRNYAMNVSREAVARCAKLGQPKLVLHPGTWAGSSSEFLVGIFRELVIDAVAQLVELAAEHEQTVCVENMLGNGPDDDRRHFGAPVEDLVEICSSAPGAMACLDTGHAFFNGENPAECAKTLADAGLLAATHVQDTDGFPHDRHWLPGRGGIDWKAFVDALKETGYGGTFVLEVSRRHGDAEDLAREGLALREQFGLQ